MSSFLSWCFNKKSFLKVLQVPQFRDLQFHKLGVFLQVPENIVFLVTWDKSLFGVVLFSVFVSFALHNFCSGPSGNKIIHNLFEL